MANEPKLQRLEDGPEIFLPYLDENFNWGKHNTDVELHAKQGYVPMPNWWPGGYPGNIRDPKNPVYHYLFVGGFEPMMRPAPRIRDWLAFRIMAPVVLWFTRGKIPFEKEMKDL